MDLDHVLLGVYRVLLLLYPEETRSRCGRDMVECFADLLAAAREGRGTAGLLDIAARTYLELPASAWRARRTRRKRTTRRGGVSVETFWQDVSYGLRGLVKSPAFTALAVLSLALGVGANTTMFSMANGIIWRRLPVPEPDRLVRILEVRDGSGRISMATFRDLTAQTTDVFDGTLTHVLNSFSVASDEISRLAHGELVSEGYFDVLGIEPGHGRFFDVNTEGTAGAPLVVVLSHHLWKDAFGEDPGIVGSVVRLSGYPATVIGVAPESFQGTKYGLAMDLWVPIRTWATLEGWDGFEEERTWNNNLVIARLAGSATVDDANAALEVVAARLQDEYPLDNRDVGYRAYPEREGAITRAVPILLDLVGVVLLGASGLVLLVACGNVASMLLARAASREAELGLRRALGAGRGRLMRQMLTETSILALLGSAAGAGLSYWLAPIRGRYLPSLPYRFAIDTAPDLRVLGFAAGAAVLATFAAGTLPALRGSGTGVGSLLRGSGTGSASGGGGRLMGSVVAAMVALSFGTLFTASTFMSSMAEIRSLDPGFETRNGLLATVDLALSGGTDEEALPFLEELIREVEALPGVQSAATAFLLPLGDMSWISPVYDAARAYAEEDAAPGTWQSIVSTGYFRTAGTRLVAGRAFTRGDGPDGSPVAIVNQALAERLWPGEDPLGRRVRFGRTDDDPWAEVVGVVATGRYTSMAEGPLPALFRPLRQTPATRATLVVRTAVPPETLAAPVREALARIDSNVPMFDVKTLDQHYAASLWLFRMASDFALALGLLALGLATAGLYGIVSFSVGRRRREMGIRLAMGASTASLLRTVLLRGLRPAGIGIAVGVGLSMALAGALRALLVGVEPRTLEDASAVAAALVVISLLAAAGPALSAVRTDPVRAITTE
jgi:putative ABC transport system permease protein